MRIHACSVFYYCFDWTLSYGNNKQFFHAEKSAPKVSWGAKSGWVLGIGSIAPQKKKTLSWNSHRCPSPLDPCPVVPLVKSSPSPVPIPKSLPSSWICLALPDVHKTSGRQSGGHSSGKYSGHFSRKSDWQSDGHSSGKSGWQSSGHFLNIRRSSCHPMVNSSDNLVDNLTENQAECLAGLRRASSGSSWKAGVWIGKELGRNRVGTMVYFFLYVMRIFFLATKSSACNTGLLCSYRVIYVHCEMRVFYVCLVTCASSM